MTHLDKTLPNPIRLAPSTPEPLEIDADVLIVGGGLAGTWAASQAAREGARVVLVDKGWCGTSGVTATAGPGHWWVPPDGEARATAVANRVKAGLGLGDPQWMARVIEETWNTLPTLADYYRFPTDHNGIVQYRGLRGMEYMRALRNLITDLGVLILDHSPALELLADGDGAVVGASGIRRQAGGAPWRVHAGAVVIATGGCAFLSHLLGCHTNTGDGYLMAAEAGADFSGMEFATYYTEAPKGTTMTRSMVYAFARYFDSDGRELDIAGPDRTRALARELIKGPVFALLDRVPEDVRAHLPTIQPNTQAVFDRIGVNPYEQRFEITLHGEGTVRGIGGLRLTGEDCRTVVPGLFAAGDAATRELAAGAISGGGAVNSAWALSSGKWAGRGAAAFARARGKARSRRPVALGQAGLRPLAGAKQVDTAGVLRAVQRDMHDYDRNIFRSGPRLERSAEDLEAAWRELSRHLHVAGPGLLRARETAAMLATARWCHAAAVARTESRGMHQRDDAPGLDERLTTRLTVAGLDTVSVAPERRPAAYADA